MDFAIGPEAEAFRAEIRAMLAESVTAEALERVRRSGTFHDWDLHRAMAERRWIAPTWPVSEGGAGRRPEDLALLFEELARAGAPVDGWGTTMLVANTLRLMGTDAQRAEVVPRLVSGEILVCLGYSEPDSGSDVAAARTRAVRDGDSWVIDGHKMFTTLAQEASYVFLLTRTNPDVPKHRGLTMFLVPLDTPGIEIQPVHTLGGERTNATFYSGVRVPDDCRVGEVDGGWDVMAVALTFERGGTGNGMARQLLDQMVDWARGQDSGPGGCLLDDALTRERLARAETVLEVGRLLSERTVWMANTGRLPGVEGSMAKLFTSEVFQRVADDLIGLGGPEGLRGRATPGALMGGELEHAYRHSVVTTIYGGTSEIQRGVIAERGLGLPRVRRG